MPPSPEISKYIHKFSHLRTDRTGGWTAATQNQAPHKPLLLLVVIDLFAQGSLPSNLIEITPELGELFAAYWAYVMPPDRRGNLALPVFHLRSSGFWHLLPQPGQEEALRAVRQVDTLSRLRKLVIGASLDEELHCLLQVEESRNVLRTVLIQTYFSPDLQAGLLAQGEINRQVFRYSQELIENTHKQVKDGPYLDEAYKPMVRDHGFRRAVVRIYDHRCAFCGVRVMTAEGRTVVDAAHIIPWRVSQNDDPLNGLALCRLCHWTFDAGLMGVSNRYILLCSSELRSSLNLPGQLVTLDGRGLLGPEEKALWPDTHSLVWHRQNVFRK
jgi:putative restriction endonuclease